MADPAIAEAARRIAGARHVAVLTGAGVSAESGVPTFGLITSPGRPDRFVIEVHLEPTPASGQVDRCLLGLAGTILPQLLPTA